MCEFHSAIENLLIHMKSDIILLYILLLPQFAWCQHTAGVYTEICGHKVQSDNHGKLLGWFQPETPGASYHHVINLASEFMLRVPVETKTGQKMYFVTCCFEGPHLHQKSETEAPNGLRPEHWLHNPACVFSGSVHSFASGYYQYTGDHRYIQMVREMLDYQLDHGTTPGGWEWENVPYASADPFEKEYTGGTKWEKDRYRGDGLHGIEPDKVGELGYAYLRFYQISGDEKYLKAAVNCADALAKHVRKTGTENAAFDHDGFDRSPWPFRVNARTGLVYSEYCSNVVEPIRLFDELIRIKDAISLDKEKAGSYIEARQIAWDWLYSNLGPMKTYAWSQYFEDVPNDPERANRNQVTPMEWAKYLMHNPAMDDRMDVNIPSLIYWVLNTFGDDSVTAIKEQMWCFESMGSHSARFGAVCAMWYAQTGDEKYKDMAYRHLNYATYMTYANGVVAVGHNWLSSWFSDGYSDYVRHFIDAMAAVPEWAPADENHLLASSSAVQSIEYKNRLIELKTFDNAGKLRFKLTNQPSKILVNGKAITSNHAKTDFYTLQESEDGACVLNVGYSSGNNIQIILKN